MLPLYFPLITLRLSLSAKLKKIKVPWRLHVVMDSLLFCFMLCSPPPLHHHLLLPAALGCAVTCSLRSFSSDRSNTLNRSSFARDSMMIEEILAPTKDTVRSNFCLLIIFYFFSLFLSAVFTLCSLFFCLVVTLSSPGECVFSVFSSSWLT